MSLDIVYEDDLLVAVNKPHGLLVHRTSIAKDAREFALQILRDQIGQRVFPAHRIDRKTSGVLLFSKTKEVDRYIQKQFMEHTVKKAYLAIVRGFLHIPGEINYAIGEKNKKKEALTKYVPIEQFELDIALGKHKTSRYSLLDVRPQTGRFHQIRKHLAHIFHPIIGDRPHGCSKQNRLWKQEFEMDKMMLHNESLEILHPNKSKLLIRAEISPEFSRVLSILRKKKYHGSKNSRIN